MKESKIQKKTIALLAANDFLAIPVERRGERGYPDLIVYSLHHPKQVAHIELKTAIGRLSTPQELTISLLKIWGHDVGIARTPEEALEHARKVFYGPKINDADATNYREAGKAQNQSRLCDFNHVLP